MIVRHRLLKAERIEKLFLLVVELSSRRESPHSDGITDPESLQQTSATKSANNRLRAFIGYCYYSAAEAFAAVPAFAAPAAAQLPEAKAAAEQLRAISS
jgi:hypothetical protein